MAGGKAAGRFDQVSIGLHWLTLALVAAQLTTAGLLLAQSPGDDPALLLAIHRSTGVATWLIVAARLAWRLFAHTPPFPASMPKPMQWAAKANEYGLYALLLAQPLTGLGDALTHGHRFMLFGLEVPRVMKPQKALFHAFETAHAAGAVLLLALITLHTGAALFHALARRDGVFGRMLPWTAR